MRQTAQTKRNDASKALLRAEDYMKSGYFDRAAQESDRANHDYQQIQELERAAMDCDHRAAELEARAFALEKRENELKAISRAQIEQMERLKRTL